MTKGSIFTLVLSMSITLCAAQSNTFPSTGNVGVGTTVPIGKVEVADSKTIAAKWMPSQSLIHLHDGAGAEMIMDGNELYGSHGLLIGISYSDPLIFRKVNASGFANLMALMPSGWLGIGTDNPLTKLHLQGSDTKFITLTRNGLSKSGHIGYGTANDGGIYLGTDDNPYILWAQQNGNVGIGTENPKAKLAVNGNILAKEIKIKTDISVPDYVFEPDYELPELAELEAYVKEHRHLPEVPSAKDIERNGLDLAEMNLLLLKKVEELTLRLIEQHKRITYLERQAIENTNDPIKTIDR